MHTQQDQFYDPEALQRFLRDHPVPRVVVTPFGCRVASSDKEADTIRATSGLWCAVMVASAIVGMLSFAAIALSA